jgi:modulator of FtsH protease HflK
MVRLLLCLAALVFLVYTASTALTQVQPGERAVIRRFGRFLDHKPEPGLYIGWPWGIEQVDLIPVSKARTIVVGFMDRDDKEEDVAPAGQMLTGDHNLVNVQAVIDFKVRDNEVEKFLLQKDNIDALTARAAESLLAEWIGGREVDKEVLLRGKIELPRYLREQLQQRVDAYDLGIEIEQANIHKLFPPEQVKEAFDSVAQAKNNIGTKVNKAEQDAAVQLSRAQEKKFDIERQAKAYETEQRIKAGAEADGFRKRLDQYRELARKDPDYLNTLWLDEMTRLYARMKEAGRIELLDHYLTNDGLSITQFPLQPKKK